MCIDVICSRCQGRISLTNCFRSRRYCIYVVRRFNRCFECEEMINAERKTQTERDEERSQKKN